MSALEHSARMATTSEQSVPSETRAVVADDGLTRGIPEWSSSTTAAAFRGKPSLSMIGLLVVEMIIGYEWFISGLVKFVGGGFPAGLADELLEKSAGAPAWYGGFLKSAVIPNAELFGYAIETSELLAGVALLAGPVVWLWAWDRVSDRVRLAVLSFTAAATVGGAFLAINLHPPTAAATRGSFRATRLTKASTSTASCRRDRDRDGQHHPVPAPPAGEKPLFVPIYNFLTRRWGMPATQ